MMGRCLTCILQWVVFRSLLWAWHFHTLRCHAFSIVACLLGHFMQLHRVQLPLLLHLSDRESLADSLEHLCVFSSCSALWLLKSLWLPVFSSCSTLWLHTGPIQGLCSRSLQLWPDSLSRMPLFRTEKPENVSLWIETTDGI